MLRTIYDDVHELQFELLADCPRLRHGLFLRHGGVSQAPYGSLNTGLQVGDAPQAVKQNIEKLKTIIQTDKLVSSNQVHRCEIAEVDASSPEWWEGYDGFMTNQPHVGLMVKYADCQAAILYDPCKHALAVVHAGWRGLVEGMYAKSVQMLRQRFGSQPADLLVAISPSLGPNYAQFENYKLEFPPEFWEFQIHSNYFDLWAIAEMQLERAGILAHHIQIARICTYANPHDFFSFRRDKITGRHATIAQLLNH